MLGDMVAIRLSAEQRRKLEEMASDGTPSLSAWLRQRIDGEYESWKSQRSAEDVAAVAELSEDELRMAANFRLRPSEYLAGKRKSR